VPRRQTLDDALASIADRSSNAQPTARGAGDLLSATGLPANSGAVITEGLVLLHCVMTQSLREALVDERSVLGFMGAMRPGETLARSRDADRLALVPVPLDAASVRVYADGVMQRHDDVGGGAADLVALPGGTFQLVKQRLSSGVAQSSGDAMPPPTLAEILSAQLEKQQDDSDRPGTERWQTQLKKLAGTGEVPRARTARPRRGIEGEAEAIDDA